MLTKLPSSTGKTLAFEARGWLTHDDYRGIAHEFEQALRVHGIIRVLWTMRDLRGWTLPAAWDDFRMYRRYMGGRNIEKLAMVGDRPWEAWLARLSTPLMKGKVRYFDASRIEDAWRWLGQEGPPSPI